jgi:hypothetical protein
MVKLVPPASKYFAVNPKVKSQSEIKITFFEKIMWFSAKSHVVW